MRTIEQIESDLDAREPQRESWAIELGIAVVVSMIAAFIGSALWY